MKNYHISFLRLSGVVVIAFAFCLVSCKQSDPGVGSTDQQAVSTPIPKALPPLPNPPDSPAKIELGRHLFYDQALSVDGKVSCGSCHDIAAGLSDSRGIGPTSMGVEGQMGTRNAPSLANVAFNTSFTWDGKFTSLEAHAQGPIFNSLEMGNNFSIDGRDSSGNTDTVGSGYNSKPGPNDTLALFARLSHRPGDLQGNTYAKMFEAAWAGSDNISMDKIAKSIAAFERTFISTQSVFDKYNNGDGGVLKNNPQATHGLQLFTDVNGANCISCHSGYNFTDQQFHDNGIGVSYKMNAQAADKGRSAVSKNPADDYKFKTPSLRNVALSAPYMHDGRFATLADVLANYQNGGKSTSPNPDPRIKKIGSLHLSNQDMSDILAFLQTLTDDSFVTDKADKFSNPWTK